MDLNHRPHAYQACALTETELQALPGLMLRAPGLIIPAFSSTYAKKLFKDQFPDLSKPNSDDESRVLP